MSHLDTAYRLGAAAAQEKFAELEKQSFTLGELATLTALLGGGAAGVYGGHNKGRNVALEEAGLPEGSDPIPMGQRIMRGASSGTAGGAGALAGGVLGGAAGMGLGSLLPGRFRGLSTTLGGIVGALGGSYGGGYGGSALGSYAATPGPANLQAYHKAQQAKTGAQLPTNQRENAYQHSDNFMGMSGEFLPKVTGTAGGAIAGGAVGTGLGGAAGGLIGLLSRGRVSPGAAASLGGVLGGAAGTGLGAMSGYQTGANEGRANRYMAERSMYRERNLERHDKLHALRNKYPAFNDKYRNIMLGGSTPAAPPK